jgi:hypothetical protein
MEQDDGEISSRYAHNNAIEIVLVATAIVELTWIHSIQTKADNISRADDGHVVDVDTV